MLVESVRKPNPESICGAESRVIELRRMLVGDESRSTGRCPTLLVSASTGRFPVQSDGEPAVFGQPEGLGELPA